MHRVALALLLLLVAPPMAWGGPYEEAQDIVSDPKELAKRYDEAVRKFREAAGTNPSNVRAWYNLGLLQSMRGQTDAARDAWKKALEAEPGYEPARARLAQLRLEEGDRASAVQELEAIIEDDRYQAEARNALAEVAIAEEDWDAAIKHARNVLLGDPENTNAYLNLAVAYFRQGLTDQAWLIVSNALDRRPDAAALHNMMGLIYLDKDDSRHATESFLQALKEDPRHVDAKLNLASLELSYGDFETALSRFEEVLGVRPNDPMVLISRAVALRGLERYEEAEKGYEAALEAKPGMPKALYNLCVLHHQYTNKWEEAKSACERYQATLDQDDPRRKEIAMRLEGIEATLEALRAEEERKRREQEQQEQQQEQEGAGGAGTDGEEAGDEGDAAEEEEEAPESEPEPGATDEPGGGDGGSASEPGEERTDTAAHGPEEGE
ncbi:MAG: tetratricopeptide repeat protein [Myxococcota bacterium]